MSQRNLVWLVIVVVVGVAAGAAFGIGWGFLAAAIALVASEIVERAARARRRKESGAPAAPGPRSVITNRRRTR